MMNLFRDQKDQFCEARRALMNSDISEVQRFERATMHSIFALKDFDKSLVDDLEAQDWIVAVVDWLSQFESSDNPESCWTEDIRSSFREAIDGLATWFDRENNRRSILKISNN